jgi:hypothetical protein
VDIDVDQLGPQRAAEGRAQVAGLEPEDHVEDLEPLDVACWRLVTCRRAVLAGCSSSRPAAMSRTRRTYWAADQVSGDAEPTGLPLTKPIEASSGGVPNGEAARSGVLPALLGDEAEAGGEAAHGVGQPRGGGAVAEGEVVLGPLAGQHGPQVAVALAGRRPGPAVAVAVAVAGVAVPARAAGRVAPDVGVDDREGAEHVGVVGSEDAEAGQLQEAGVDDLALVEGGPAVAHVVSEALRTLALR